MYARQSNSQRSANGLVGFPRVWIVFFTIPARDEQEQAGRNSATYDGEVDEDGQGVQGNITRLEDV